MSLLIQEFALAEEIGHDAAPGSHGVRRIFDALLASHSARVVFQWLDVIPLVSVSEDPGEEIERALYVRAVGAVVTAENEFVQVDDRIADARVSFSRVSWQ